KVSDEDVKAIYAFVMTRDAVRGRRPPNALAFPANFRGSLRAWKALYFRSGRFEPDTTKSARWNRGAYLAEGLAHCGACHTPRNLLEAEKVREAYAGAPIENWIAPALTDANPSPVPWTQDDLFSYLRSGISPLHGVSAGPMAPVV